MMAQILRDFLYLDIDKTRSLVAQANEGFPEALEKTTAQRGGGSLKLLEYAMEKTSSETVSVHHHLYSILEAFLLSQNKVLELLDASKARKNWSPEIFQDGRFVLAEGRIYSLDYASMISGLGGLGTVMKISVGFQEAALKKSLQAQEITQREFSQKIKEIRQNLPEVKDISAIMEGLRTLYGDALRLRLYPSRQNSDEHIVANLSRVYLQRQQADVLGSIGLASSGSWKMFGLLDRFEPFQAPPTSGTNNLENVMQGLLEAFSSVGQMTLATEWPAVAVTPIAVYRDV
jgi:hypothetical protein